MTELTEEFVRNRVGHYFKHNDNDDIGVVQILAIRGEEVICWVDTNNNTYVRAIEDFCEMFSYVDPDAEFPCKVEDRYIPIWENELLTAVTSDFIYITKEKTIEEARSGANKGRLYGYWDLETNERVWVGRK